IFALTAFRRVERDHVVAFGKARHAAPDIDDDARPLMTEDRREKTFRIAARPRELVGMADPGRLDLDQHLSVLGAVELNLLDLERLTGLESDSSACLHGLLPGFGLTRTDIDAAWLIAFATYRRQEPGCWVGWDRRDQK